MRKSLVLLLSTISISFADFIGVSVDLRDDYAKGVDLFYQRQFNSYPTVGYRFSFIKTFEIKDSKTYVVSDHMKESKSCSDKGPVVKKLTPTKLVINVPTKKDSVKFQLDFFKNYTFRNNLRLSPFIGIGYSAINNIWKDNFYGSTGLMLSYLYDNNIQFGISYEKDYSIRDIEDNEDVLKTFIAMRF